MVEVRGIEPRSCNPIFLRFYTHVLLFVIPHLTGQQANPISRYPDLSRQPLNQDT